MIPSQRKSNTPVNYGLNPKLIQEAYINARNNNRILEALTNIFHVIGLSSTDSQNTGIQRAQINRYINTNMLPDPAPLQSKKPILNSAAVYPVNKGGALGVLVRQCTIVDKGLMEKDGNKPPTLKQINNFINRVQSYEKTQNKQKLQWLKDTKLYPLRIILIDNKNAPKGLYFKDKKQADIVRIDYTQKFRYKGNIDKLKKQIFRKYKTQITEQFAEKLKIYLYLKKKKRQDQKNKMNQKQKKSQQPSLNKLDISKRQEDLLENLLDKSSISKSNRGYDTNVMKLLIDKQQSRISSGKDDTDRFLKLEKMYKANLFESWKIMAHQIEDNNQIEGEEQSIKNINYNNMKSKSKYINNLTAPKFPNLPSPEKKPLGLTYKSIQFFKEHQIFVKPIVVISLIRNGSVENETKFNTIIQKKEPHLSYQLIANSGDQTHRLKANPNQYELVIKAIDYLSNTEMCNDKIELKSKVISVHTLMTNNDKTIRLQLIYEDGFERSKPDIKLEDNPQGSYLQILPISEKTIENIRNHWEKEVIKRSYYNMSRDIKIIEIFQLYQQPPKSWVLGLTESDYQTVNILNSASKILNFKLTESILPIVRILQKLYSDFNELIEVCLSIIINYMHPYYFISQFNKINKLHSLLGLEGELQLTSKIGFQLELIKKIIKIQCPDVEEKLKRKNIGYAQLLYQYIYEIFSKNFYIRILVELWNFLFREPAMLPIYMVLISAWLIKFYGDKLKKCRKFRQARQILESRQTCSAETMIRQVIILRQKYFSAPNNINLIDSLRGMFNVKPLQQVVVEFYKRQTERLDKKKENRNAEKKLVLKKLSNQMKIELPKYTNRSYCLHIYFYKLPAVGGSLYIKANSIEYECLNISRNRYFIIGEVNTQISLEFINNKSDQFTCKLQCMQGINKYTVHLKSDKTNQTYKVQYICGLLTEGHMEVLKKNRKFQHYIGAFAKQEQVFDQFLRPINECTFLNSFIKRLQKEDLGKKIKVVFSSGSKNFDQIQFYLRWISESSITFKEKLKLIKEYASIVSQQYFLSDCKQLCKIFISRYLQLIEFHISADQFESYYSDSVQQEFKSPKIIKCRVILPNNSEIKLQQVAISYLAGRNTTHIFEDVIIGDLIAMIQKQIEQNLANVTQATINIIYSNYGQIHCVQIPVIKKKSSKQLIINEAKFQFQNSEINDISTAQPQVLVTEVLPTFSKISTILDFVNSSKSVQSLGKNKQSKKVAESINLLKNCDLKYNKVLLMRYETHPDQIQIPFLNYYHQLIYDSLQPSLPKNLFLNNLQTDIKTICTYHGTLNFSDNKKIQSTILKKDYGLYANLRILPPKTDYLYFISVLNEEQIKQNGQIFINYGYGVYRWEPCIVLGYYLTVKQKENKLKQEKKTRKQYLVSYKNSEKLCRDFQLKIDPNVEKQLQQLDLRASSLKVGTIRKPGEISGSKRQNESKKTLA